MDGGPGIHEDGRKRPVLPVAPEHVQEDPGIVLRLATGKCVGGNSCKGQSACATASTSCAGQNACQGQGWTETTKAECEEAGGEFESA